MVTDPGEEVAIIRASPHIANHLHREDELWQPDGLSDDCPDCWWRALPASGSDATVTHTRFRWEDLLGRVSCPLCSMLQSFLWAESLVCVIKWPNTYNFLAEKVREKAKSIHSKEIWKIHHANISGTPQAAHQ